MNPKNCFLKKAFFTTGYVLASIILLAGCQVKEQTVSVAGPKELFIGVVLPETGQYDMLGKSAKQAIEFALDEINQIGGVRGTVLKVIFVDDQSQASKATEAINSLAERNDVVAIIGGMTDELAFAGGIQANRKQVVFITPAAGAIGVTELGPYIFRNKINYSVNTTKLVEYLFQIEGNRTFAIMYPFNEYGVNVAEIAARRIGELGGVVAGKESYSTDMDGLNSTIYKLRDQRIQVLFVPCYSSELPGIAQQLYQSSHKMMMSGINSWTDDGSISRGIEFLEGAIFTTSFYVGSSDQNIKGFVNKYKQKYGKTPDSLAAHCVDTVRLLVQCMYAGGFTRETLKDELQRIKNFPGLTGLTTFNANREAEKPLLFLTVTGGKIEKLQ
ncbi:MAG: ABC transporter substrate-binding protein [bacterium]|nr:ABC transporter substrate-binding protein [bacterium]MDD5354194.1 ABC transporter substrate-binding protein [bacterium]MDD5756324.1 ABC transporter substrate-binding protein [bacterium]